MKSKTGWILVVVTALFLAFFIWHFSFIAGASIQGGEQEKTVRKKTPNLGYRSRGNRHKVRVKDPAKANALMSQGARLIGDYQSYKLLEVDSETANELSKSDEIEVNDHLNLIMLNTGPIDTLDGENSDQKQNIEQRLAAGGKRLRLIQFAGPIKPEWYEELVASGVKVVSYIPNNSYLVFASQGSMERFGALSKRDFVQWEGEYKDQYKIHPDITTLKTNTQLEKPEGSAAVNRAAATQAEGQLIALQLVEDKDGNNPATIGLIEQLQTEPTLSQWDVLEYRNFIVRLTQEGIQQIAKRPDVVSLAPWVVPQKMDERQNQIIAGNLNGNLPVAGGDWLAYLASKGFTQEQFTSSGFAINLSDSGIDNATTSPNHFALWVSGVFGGTSRVVYNRLEGTPHAGSTLQGCDGHGNINAHIIGGYVPGGGPYNAFPHIDAAGFRFGLGVTPFIRVGSSVIFDPDIFTNPNLVNLESKAYNDGARISSNSWGANVAGAYNIASQTFDAIVRDAQSATSTFPVLGNQEYVVVFSAGNAGPGGQSVGAPGTAKNVITVGAAENVQSFGGADGCGVGDLGADSANDMISFSSRGPTSDGRRKPDIVAPGTHITGGVFQATSTPPPLGLASPCFNGTGVCGGVGINFFPAGQQFYTASSGTSHSAPAVAGAVALARQHFINKGMNPPSPAMTKATLMNSSRYMNGAGANDNLWSNSQGMGELNLNSFFEIFDTPSILRDQTVADIFTASGQQRVFSGRISDPSKPFRVTLAWTDPPGPTTGNAFINNLDLEVIVGNNTYKGNVFSGAFSATGGSADIRNNVESILIPAGVTGNFVVFIRATNIAGDGVPNVGGPLDQDFALVIFNGVQANVPLVQSDASMILAESCAAGDGAISPGETVTLSFALKNNGTANTSNVVATIQTTGGVTMPSGPQNYGVLTAQGAAVARPFTFTADPNLLCGDNLTATLSLQDGSTNLGTVSFSFSLGALGPIESKTYSTGGISVAIPDLSTIEVPIEITDRGAVADVNVKLRLDHTFDGDLDIFLVHPDGTEVELSTDNGGAGDNYGSGAPDCSGTPTIFDDSAVAAISSGVAPFAGSFRPEQSLSALNGKAVNGTWKLRITDDAGADVGTVFCLQLEINRRKYFCCGIPGAPLIVAAPPAAITAESCSAGNGAADPDETVTVQFPLRNNGDGVTSNLIATLLPGGGVLDPSGPQNYGALSPIGPAILRPFTFTVAGMCGGVINATFQLRDGPTDLGTATFTLPVGATLTATSTYTNPASIAIPAGTATSGPADPYPSVINVSGITAPVTNVTVTLTNINHTFPDDVDFLLVGPGGQKVMLMSDAGGGLDIVNTTLTFDDAAAEPVPDGTQITSGTFRPSDYVTGDILPAPAPPGPFASQLSVFNGVDPNGAWNLFVFDDAGGDIGSIAGGWTINITTATPSCCASACVLTVPADIIRDNDPGACGAAVNYLVNSSGSCGVIRGMPPSGSVFPVGTTPVTVTGTRQDGTITSSTFNVTVNNPTTTTVTSSAGQYSDMVLLQANVTNAVCTGGQVEFKVEGVTVGAAPVGPGGIATLPYTINLAAGSYSIQGVYTSSSAGTSTGLGSLTVLKENAMVTVSPNNPNAVEVSRPKGTSPPITLCARIAEENDGSPGDISRASPVTFTLTPAAVGLPITRTATITGSGGTRLACVTVSNLPVNVYDVVINVGGNFYTGSADTVLVVFDPALGFVSGGGVIQRNGAIATFGFIVKYMRDDDAEGSLVYTEVRQTGIVKLKSTSIQALSIVGKTGIFLGKGKLNDVANHSFRVTVTDNGESGRSDLFGLQVARPGGAIIPDLTFDPLQLFGGNIQVHGRSHHSAQR